MLNIVLYYFIQNLYIILKYNAHTRFSRELYFGYQFLFLDKTQ